jgi:hypothetical protein
MPVTVSWVVGGGTHVNVAVLRISEGVLEPWGVVDPSSHNPPHCSGNTRAFVGGEYSATIPTSCFGGQPAWISARASVLTEGDTISGWADESATTPNVPTS